MSKKQGRDNDEELNTAVALGVGVGLIVGAVAHQKHEQRQAFKQKLAESLQDYGIEMVNSEFARGPQNEPVWKLTVTHPALGVTLLRFPFAQNSEPYARETLRALIDQTVAKMNMLLQRGQR